MGAFEKAVKAEKVLGPLRSGFKSAKWRGEHGKLGNDDIDRELMEAGLLISAKANTVRSALKLTFSNDFKATTKIRAFVALANHNFCVISSKTQEAMNDLAQTVKSTRPNVPMTSQELATLTLRLPSGVNYAPDEIIQAAVDGAQVPLKRILENDPDLSGNPEFGKLSWDDALMDLNLGVLYTHAESLWDDCVWNSYRTQRTVNQITFAPREIAWQARDAISQMRYANLAHEFAAHSIQIYGELAATGRRPLFGPFTVKAIKTSGKRQQIRLAENDSDSIDLVRLLVMRSYASEPYYDELIDEAQSLLKGASLSHLLTAWAVVSSSAELLRRQVEAAGTADSEDPRVWLPKYAPTIQIDALTRTCETAARCSYEQAKTIVEFLVYRGGNEQEIWAQPLLPVGKETVVPFFSATKSPNLRRLIDVWLNQLNVDLARRGPAFELYVRSSLVRDIATSPLLSGSARCLETALKFTPQGEREEEIDVVLLVGDLVLLGEVKCFLQPTGAKKTARHRDKVVDAVGQIQRKASAVERNKEAFRKRTKQVGLDLPESFRVLPVVILNNAIHVGVPIDGVPVVDEYILGVFFRGEFVERALKTPGKGIEPVKKRVLYVDADEGSHVLPKFLAEPPQMEPLLRGIKSRWIPIPNVNKQDWQGQFLTVACVPTTEFAPNEQLDGSIAEAGETLKAGQERMV